MASSTVNINFSANIGNLQTVGQQVVNALHSIQQAANGANASIQTLTRSLAQVNQAARQSTGGLNAAAQAASRVGAANAAAAATARATTAAQAATTAAVVGTNTATTGFARGGLAQATGGVKNLNTGLMGAIRNFAEHNSVINLASHSYRGLVGQVANMNRFLNVTFSSIRQIGQGLQNFGMVFSLYFSLPIVMLLKGALNNLIEFDDALIEVRKTTGLGVVETEKLGKALTELSTMTSTPRVDLSQIAADLGRAGISDPNSILALTEGVDKLVISTTLKADDVIPIMTKIGNIYYDSWGSFAEDFEKIGSMLNELGQANPITENEIMRAIGKFGPTANIAGASIQEMFGLSASAVSFTNSPERAGTQLTAMFNHMARNQDKWAAATGKTLEETRKLMDAGIVDYLLDHADGIMAIESQTQRLNVATELWGAVGAKTGLALASNTALVRRNIELANEEFDKGTSLQLEFERAMDGVKNQVGLLKNNFTYLTSTIGSSVLPIMTKLILFLVPAIQMLTFYFDSLDESTRLWVIGIGLALTALGPLIIILGTFMFSLGIIGTGLTTFMTNIINIGLHVARLGAYFLLLTRPLMGIILLLSTFAFMSTKLTGIFGNIGTQFQNLINNAYAWGYNIIASFSSGMARATSLVYRTVSSIVNSFIGLIRSFSPPREGPLTGIEDWGENLIESYATGMMRGVPMTIDAARTAAMGIADALRGSLSSLSSEGLGNFSQIFGWIQTIATSVGSYFEDGIGFDIQGWLGEAATALVDFIETGSGLGALGNVLGSFVGDFERLIGLQRQYNDATKELDRITDALKNVDKVTDQQIQAIARRTDLTLDQRTALIRAARLEGSERKKSLEEQKDAAEDEQKAASDALKNQQQLITTLIGLLQSLDDKKKSASGGELDSLLGDLGGDEDIARIQDGVAKASEEAGRFFTRLSSVKEAFDGFMRGVQGDFINPIVLAEMSESFREGYERGLDIYYAITSFVRELDSYKQAFVDAAVSFRDGAVALYDAFTNGLFMNSSYNTQQLNTYELAVYKFGLIVATVLDTIDGALINLAILVTNDLPILGSTIFAFGRTVVEFVGLLSLGIKQTGFDLGSYLEALTLDMRAFALILSYIGNEVLGVIWNIALGIQQTKDMLTGSNDAMTSVAMQRVLALKLQNEMIGKQLNAMGQGDLTQSSAIYHATEIARMWEEANESMLNAVPQVNRDWMPQWLQGLLGSSEDLAAGSSAWNQSMHDMAEAGANAFGFTFASNLTSSISNAFSSEDVTAGTQASLGDALSKLEESQNEVFENAGKSLGSRFVTGIDAGIQQGPLPKDAVDNKFLPLIANGSSTGFVSMLEMSIAKIQSDLTGYGDKAATTAAEGYAAYWQSEDAKERFGVFLPAIESWVNESKPKITSDGEKVGETFSKGVSDEITAKQSGIGAVADSFNSLLTGDSINRVREIGFDLGVEFAKQVGLAISKSHQYISTALIAMITGELSSQKLQDMLSLLPSNPNRGLVTAPVGASANLGGGTSASSVAASSLPGSNRGSQNAPTEQFVFHVNIDRETVSDRSHADRFISDIKREFEQERRYGKIR